MAPKPPASPKVRALQWLAQREHSRAELRAKLLRLMNTRSATACEPGAEDRPRDGAGAAADVDALLDWLAARGYLSQQRFVESRVHARQARFGHLRIQRELQHHGVELDAEAAQALKATEFERAREVWRKKFGTVPDDAAARLRQMRFLAGRGFSAEVIRRIVRADGADD